MTEKITCNLIAECDLPVLVGDSGTAFITSANVLQASENMANLMQDRLRTVIELLIAGVAFRKDNNLWEVVSHEGCEIGRLSTYMLSTAVTAMQQAGLQATSNIAGPDSPESITFGYCYTGLDYPAIAERRHGRYVDLT